MRDLARQRQRLLPPLARQGGVPQRPQRLHQPGQGGDSGLLPPEKRGGGGLPGLGETQALLQVGPGGAEVTLVERELPHRHLTRPHEAGVRLVLRQGAELLAQRVRGLQLPLGAMKRHEAPERVKALRHRAHLVG